MKSIIVLRVRQEQTAPACRSVPPGPVIRRLFERVAAFADHQCFSGGFVPEGFRDGVVRRIDNHAVRATERFFLAVRHDGHPITQPEVQSRAAVESKLAISGARKHVSSSYLAVPLDMPLTACARSRSSLSEYQ